jgi:hypothetical protein
MSGTLVMKLLTWETGLWSMCRLGPAMSQSLLFCALHTSQGGAIAPVFADAEVLSMNSDWMKRLNAVRGYLYAVAAIAIRIAWLVRS